MPLITAKTGLSPGVLNSGFVFTGTGTEIAALGSTAGPVVAFCQVSGSNFLADHVYFRKVGGTWQVLNLSRHDHAQDDDDSGGLLSAIEYANTNQVYKQSEWGYFANSMQVEVLGSAGGFDAAVYANDRTLGGGTGFGTAPLATSVANAVKSGRKHDWSKPSRFDVKLRAVQGTQIIARAGVCVDPLITSNTSNTCYGVEFCDSTGVNWQIASSDGVTRSLLGTTLEGSHITPQLLRLEHFPGASGSVKLTAGMDTSPFWVKTSNVPQPTGTSSSGNTISMGVKTQENQMKTMVVWGFTFVSVPSPVDV